MTNDDLNDRTRNPQDAQLDAIASQLREQTIPPVPRELLRAPTPEGGEATRSRRMWLSRRVIGAMATAAAILSAVLWNLASDPKDKQRPNQPRVVEVDTSGEGLLRPKGLAVSVMSLRHSKLYANLDRELDGMEKEIAELNRRVALLDVCRITDLLLALD